MADEKKETNGSGAAATADQQLKVQAKIVNQYIKDLSFENPNIRKLITNPGDQPNVKLEIQVNGSRVDRDLYESAIEFKAVASNNIGTIYVLEVVYAGLLRIESIPENALEPFLLISGPSMLFPFLRRLVADTTREGGYPPLMLDPVDFAGLYMSRQQERAAAGKANV